MVDAADFAELVRHIGANKISGQEDSHALLQWFLFNVFRLDEVDTRDSLCDGKNDKGIDAVWVDEDTEEIFLFQAKFTADPGNSLGDVDLKAFVGSAQWFSRADNIRNLLQGNANASLKALVSHLGVESKLQAGYEVRLVFVSTRTLDDNGAQYLGAVAGSAFDPDVWDCPRLLGQLKSLERKTRVPGAHRFAIGIPGFEYAAAGGIHAYVGPVRASDLASMNGIADRSLFALNVRSGLGRTRVNRDIERAIRQQAQHDQFVLFHNGVTIISRQLRVLADAVEIEDYSVVNGCQSTISFFENRSKLTGALQIVCRLIEVGDNDALAEEITYRSNNQNGINLRDLRSNDRVQLSLRNQFSRIFGAAVEYAIKAGEEAENGDVIKNDRAGQWLMALFLDEPYAAHQKAKVFGPDYERVFSRHVDAFKIYFAFQLNRAIENVLEKVDDPLIRTYQLTKFILIGVAGRILRNDPVGRQLLERPQDYLPGQREPVSRALQTFIGQLIPDFNFYIKEKQAAGYYDYKTAFKSSDEYQALAREVHRNYDRAVVRHPEDTFARIMEGEVAKV